MKKYDFTIPKDNEKVEEKKPLLKFKSIFKDKEKSKKSTSIKKERKLEVNSDFKRLFQFQKQKMLAYPIDKEITDDGLIHTTINGKSEYSYILGVQGHYLRGLSDEEYTNLISQYWTLHKSYQAPFKEIFAPFPEKSYENIEFLQHRNATATERAKIFNSNQNEIELKNNLRDEEIRKLQIVQDSFQSRQSFIAVYGETEERLEANLNDMLDYGQKLLSLSKLEKEEVELLFRILNGTDKEPHGNTAPKKINFNYAQYIMSNDKPEAIVTVTSLAQKVNYLWMSEFTSNSKVFATTIDYGVGKDDYEKAMASSLEVLNRASKTAKRDANHFKFNSQYALIQNKLNSIQTNGEVIKLTTIRMLVRANDVDELQTKVKQLVTGIESKGHKARVFSNMGFFDWSSKFVSSKIQSDTSIGRYGVERSSEAIARGFAHNQTSIRDKNGLLYGRTRTGGSVLFNQFMKGGSRLSYDMFITGSKGSGKSTFLKKLMLDNYIHDNFLYVYDKARECEDLIKYLNGTYISLDGSNGKINMFQIFPLVVTNDNEDSDNKEDMTSSIKPWECFNSHLSKLVDHFQKWTELNKDGEIDTVYILDSFYKDYFSNKGYAWKHFDITALDNKDYPTFTDFYQYLKAATVPSSYEMTKEKLEKMAYSVITTKAEKFVGTTTMDRFLTQQIVAFDISNISDGKSDDFDILFSISLDMVLSLCQSRGRKEKFAFEKLGKPFDDVTRSLIVIDECHTVLNPHKLKNTDTIVNAMREDRKYFYGFALATQMIQTMLPTNAKQVGGSEGSAIQNMSDIVGLCQYKAWMRQTDTSIPTLKKYFDDNFKESDYQEMKEFELVKDLGSQMILSGAGRRSTEMYFYATPLEIDLFRGGA